MFNAYPNENARQFNNIDKWDRKSARLKREFLLTPEDTEFFEIESPRESRESEPKEIIDFPKQQKQPSSVWDILGVMATIRKSFFSDFFSPAIGKLEIKYILIFCK